jgi:hypothetical protein
MPSRRGQRADCCRATRASAVFPEDYARTHSDHIDVETYGGDLDLARRATAPKLRIGRDRWFNLGYGEDDKYFGRHQTL